MDHLTTILTGVLSGILSALLTMFALRRLRPKIDISPVIAKNTNVYGANIFDIKIVNITRRDLIDVRLELTLVTKEIVPGGMINTLKEIALKTNTVFMVPKFSARDTEARYARRFEIIDDLDSIWHDDSRSYLRFRIFAVDSFSGIGCVFEKHFYQKPLSIKVGKHHFGNDLSVS